MTNKKPQFKLQREYHTFATFFATCNAYNNKQDGGRAKSTFLATRNATIAVAKWGVTREFFLATQQTLRCKLQEKLLRVTWP